MTAIRILHIDDEPDLREIIEISLDIRSCESGTEGVVVAADWNPDVILLDVMMPVMDGIATLMVLRENPKTAGIPVIFMTARAQARELDRFRSLGAFGVIAKPFDPMTLAAAVRNYLRPQPDPVAELRAGFLQRVSRDMATLAEHRDALRRDDASPTVLEGIRNISHSLSGAGGIYGFSEISDAAATLEDAALDRLAGKCSDEALSNALDGLIALEPCNDARQVVLELARTG
jgi:two-component system OmpR family response regulator